MRIIYITAGAAGMYCGSCLHDNTLVSATGSNLPAAAKVISGVRGFTVKISGGAPTSNVQASVQAVLDFSSDTKPLAPIAPPARWLQVLAKTGAARFEKDTKSQTVRFSRPSAMGATDPLLNNPGTVPVVEIDGARYPTKLREEALAGKRK